MYLVFGKPFIADVFNAYGNFVGISSEQSQIHEKPINLHPLA